MSTQYYVAPVSLGGSDANNGLAVGTPCLTLAHVGGLMASGDILNVRSDGSAVYAETLTNAFPSGGGSFATATIIQGYAGDPMPIIKSAAGASFVWQFSARNYVWIKNVIIDGGNTTTADNGLIKITITNSTTFAHHIRIDSCELRNCPAGSGVLITKGSTNTAGLSDSNEILNCNIHNNGNTTHHHDIYIESSNNLVQGCTLGVTTGYAVQIYFSNAVAGDGKSTSNNTVIGNIMTGATNGGTTINFGSGNFYANNLIYSCGSIGGNGGIQIINGSSSGFYYNNTVYNNTGPGIDLDATGGAPDSNIIENNITTNSSSSDYVNNGTNTTSDYNMTGDGTAVGAHSIKNANPSFINAAGANFHLNANSPAINVGVTLASVLTDFDGTSRPQGSAYDMGALEFIFPAPHRALRLAAGSQFIKPWFTRA